jgi:DNA-binding NtrC family response regulator
MTATILIVDDQEHARHNIKELLTPQGYEVISAATLEEARENLHLGIADIILLDVQLPDGYGPDLLEEAANTPLRPPIIVITGHGEIEMAVDAMKNGAFDFIQKPIDFKQQLGPSIKRAQKIVAMRRELNHLKESQRQKFNFIVGKSQAMQTLIHHAERAAKTSTPMLLTGETGTGKDVLAKAIHEMGPRADKLFIPLNCAAIQSTVLESELFGHEAGAFTSAQRRKQGLMEVADEGILFLNEISSMPVDMQAKLLHAIEDKQIRRVGGTTQIHVDVQILAASNRDLPSLIEQGLFREDLYYRLRVVELHLPPLRERKEDIPELVGHFLCKLNMEMGLNVGDITSRALEALMDHDWPGNIRELRNIIERAMIFCDDAVIDIEHLPSDVGC